MSLSGHCARKIVFKDYSDTISLPTTSWYITEYHGGHNWEKLTTPPSPSQVSMIHARSDRSSRIKAWMAPAFPVTDLAISSRFYNLVAVNMVTNITLARRSSRKGNSMQMSVAPSPTWFLPPPFLPLLTYYKFWHHLSPIPSHQVKINLNRVCITWVEDARLCISLLNK